MTYSSHVVAWDLMLVQLRAHEGERQMSVNWCAHDTSPHTTGPDQPDHDSSKRKSAGISASTLHVHDCPRVPNSFCLLIYAQTYKKEMFS